MTLFAQVSGISSLQKATTVRRIDLLRVLRMSGLGIEESGCKRTERILPLHASEVL